MGNDEWKLELYLSTGATVKLEVRKTWASESEQEDWLRKWLAGGQDIVTWVNENSDSKILYLRPDDVIAVVVHKED